MVLWTVPASYFLLTIYSTPEHLKEHKRQDMAASTNKVKDQRKGYVIEVGTCKHTVAAFKGTNCQCLSAAHSLSLNPT